MDSLESLDVDWNAFTRVPRALARVTALTQLELT